MRAGRGGTGDSTGRGAAARPRAPQRAGGCGQGLGSAAPAGPFPGGGAGASPHANPPRVSQFPSKPAQNPSHKRPLLSARVSAAP